MGDDMTKLGKAHAHLEPGERIIAASRFGPHGALGVSAKAALKGAGNQLRANLLAAEAAAKLAAEGSAGGLQLAPKMVLVLTDRRLMVFDQGGLRGGPNHLISAIDRRRVVGVEVVDRGALRDHVVLRLDDGSAIPLDLFRHARTEGRELIEALRAGR